MATPKKPRRDPWQQPVNIDVFAPALGCRWGNIDRDELPHWRGFYAQGVQWVREDWDSYLSLDGHVLSAERVDMEAPSERRPTRVGADLSLPCTRAAAYTWACQQDLGEDSPEERAEFLEAYISIQLRPLKEMFLRGLKGGDDAQP